MEPQVAAWPELPARQYTKKEWEIAFAGIAGLFGGILSYQQF